MVLGSMQASYALAVAVSSRLVSRLFDACAGSEVEGQGQMDYDGGVVCSKISITTYVGCLLKVIALGKPE
jgi:hypothetical protein